MHDATNVIVKSEIGNAIGAVHIEIVRQTFLNVIPGYTNKIFATVRTLHMIKTECMQELMDNGSLVNATVQLQVEQLFFADAADHWPATGILTLKPETKEYSLREWKAWNRYGKSSPYRHFNVVRFGGTLDESNATDRLDGAQTSYYFSFLGIVQLVGNKVRHNIVGPAIVQIDQSIAWLWENGRILFGRQNDVSLELTA